MGEQKYAQTGRALTFHPEDDMHEDNQPARWIHALLTGVLVAAFQALEDLDHTDALRRQEARAALDWIVSERDDHPLDYQAVCGVLGLCPKYGRRFARKFARKAKPAESKVCLYSRAG